MQNMKRQEKLKVYVGMSGGVDSSVSATLLKKQGYDVTGVFIKVWQPPFFEGCTSKEDRLDAMRVCAKIGIPFITLDLEKEYKKDVVDYMIEEYRNGRVPNPDVMCNKYVKFGAFYEFAMKNGADLIATGHYADKRELKTKNGKTKYELLIPKDTEKDQTYFLWTIGQEQLSKTIFPIGKFKKEEVRKMAKKYDLATASKKDSQGLCFIGKIEMKDFLSNFITSKIGDLTDINGNVIGSHDGAIFYTLGQRHGFNVNNLSNNQKPLYVVSKNIVTNTVVVADQFVENGNYVAKHVNLKDFNMISGEDIKKISCHCKYRYRQKLTKCGLTVSDGEVEVSFEKPQIRLSSGQSVVFYKDGVCIGGGIVDSTSS